MKAANLIAKQASAIVETFADAGEQVATQADIDWFRHVG